MAYNYLDLVNAINRRVNEVELTSSDFPNAAGFYKTAKDAVNSSIRHINQQTFEWPFNHSVGNQVLVAGTSRYSFPADAKTIDFDSFRIKRSSTFNNETKKLRPVPYEEYLDKGIDQEYNTSTGIRRLPQLITQAPSLEFVVYPSPDKAYELAYEYYTLPTDLDVYTDVPSIPVQFKHILVDGAMFYVYMFREDEQSAALYQQKFEQGIEYMRTIYVNRYREVRDTRVNQSGPNSVLRTT